MGDFEYPTIPTQPCTRVLGYALTMYSGDFVTTKDAVRGQQDWSAAIDDAAVFPTIVEALDVVRRSAAWTIAGLGRIVETTTKFSGKEQRVAVGLRDPRPSSMEKFLGYALSYRGGARWVEQGSPGQFNYHPSLEHATLFATEQQAMDAAVERNQHPINTVAYRQFEIKAVYVTRSPARKVVTRTFEAL